MQDHIFRMYDIRGIVGTELLIPQVYDCARAFALYITTIAPHVTTVAVGMDGRIHSPALKDEFVRGLQQSGLSVIFIGVCPTPLASFAEYVLPIQAACMITASHNPKEYNGIKFFFDKKPLFNQELQEVHRLFKQRKHRTTALKGSYREHALIPEYIALLTRLFPHLVGATLPLVFDCGNGAVGTVLPALCQAFQFANVTLLYADVDGTYPHHEADPSVQENMHDLTAAVLANKAAVGIAFDGDGDRMGAVSESGALVVGDKLLAFLSEPVLTRVPGARVVCDAKCSTALAECVEKGGGSLYLSPSGHAFIREAMAQHSAVIGGELSCHFFFKDRYFGFDDGIYAALRLIEIVTQPHVTLDRFLETFPVRVTSPELRVTCKQGQGAEIIESLIARLRNTPGLTISTIDGVRVVTEHGWGIVRASNTQPVLCIRFESDSQGGIEQVRSFFATLLLDWYSKDFLNSALRW